jgi:hypothetical protein
VSDLIHVRGEGGAVFAMQLPLPPHVQERYEAGVIVRVNPDGSEWSGEEPKRKPRSRASTADAGEAPDGA